jgi:putative ABC transport system substrate-binding protein
MRRRAFIAGLASAAAWQRGAQAQPAGRARRVGVIMNYDQGDREGEARLAALRQTLQRQGWIEGEDIHLEVRWGEGRQERVQADAAELVALSPDVIVANSTPAIAALRQATRRIPIVFVQVSDPLGSGFVSNMAHPDGNMTGFTDYEPSIAGKWIELIKEVAPQVTRVGVLLNPAAGNQSAFWKVAEPAAASTRLELSALGVHDRADIARAIAGLAPVTGAGLVVFPTPVTNTLRDSIIKAAAQYRIPAVYPYDYYSSDGGLLSYGIDQIDQWREAAGYVDRLLRGAKPSELPVQSPTKFQLRINLPCARALGLDIPTTLLARADEVIE